MKTETRVMTVLNDVFEGDQIEILAAYAHIFPKSWEAEIDEDETLDDETKKVYKEEIRKIEARY